MMFIPVKCAILSMHSFAPNASLPCPALPCHAERVSLQWTLLITCTTGMGCATSLPSSASLIQ